MAAGSSKPKAQNSKEAPSSKPQCQRAGGVTNSGSRNPRCSPAVWTFAFWSFFGALSLELGASQSFLLPTANHALFEPGGEEKFFVGTVGKPWTSGMFGCVRTEGWQMHEGLDIRCLQRDKRGEPTDAVMATADGTVAYINKRPSLSNYGNYIILRHQIEGMEIYSLYAHLREIRVDLRTGQNVKAGENIGVMGRTSNTRESISKERAHVHFELDLFLNERFPQWYQKTFPGQRNDHGQWNGQNLIGLDPRAVLLAQHQQGAKFRLLDFIRNQTELCRVLVRDTNFPWLRSYSALVKPNPAAEKEGVIGYELALNFNGLPFELIPRSPSEIKSKARFQLLSANAAEYQKNPCRRLVVKKGSSWMLADNGSNLLGLLTY
jgi:murein DD-endopeptidase MepM/ murein hydrolase activator NlpD